MGITSDVTHRPLSSHPHRTLARIQDYAVHLLENDTAQQI